MISPPPRFDVRKITVCDKSTRRLSPRVSVALSNIPNSNCQRASDAFSISSNSKKAQLQLLGMACRQSFLSDQRMSLPVSQIPRRRTNQLRNLMRMLEFRAIHLDHRARISKQNLRSRFHDARLARTRRSKEQQVPHRPPWRVQSRAEDLIQVHQRLHPFRLSDDLRAQALLQNPGYRCCEWLDPVSVVRRLSWHRSLPRSAAQDALCVSAMCLAGNRA